MAHYDDNFGWYDIDGEEDMEFYRDVQDLSVKKECDGCGRTVRIMPQYAYCSQCADMRERGWDF